jgi:hypothetical protein
MTYQDKVHRIGRLTAGIALALLFLPPTIISIYYSVFPPISKLLLGIGTVCMIYLPIAIAEFMTYTPMLGSSASYLVFVTGNLSNLKVPCALTCIENAGVKPQSEESEVIATISVAISSIVTTVIIFFGMILLIPLKPFLEAPVLQPAFSMIIPALFGALAGYWFLKQWKLAVFPFIVIIIIFLLVPLPENTEGILIPIMGLLSLLSARFSYKKGWIKSMEG